MANERVILHTNLGDITVEFFFDKAPKHVAAFLKLVREGFYNGIRFHRVIPGFMIQGGDPNTKDLGKKGAWGTGGPGYSLPAEFNDVKHDRGVLSAARSSDPNSAGSQFFLMVKNSPHLDRQYSAFGKVSEGMDVVDKIVALPRDGKDCPLPGSEAIIESAEVVE
ncbi:peptidylprolyl isomerase [soil metagenome]